MISTDFGDLIAERLRVEHRTLAARWFARLLDLLPVGARDIFPADSLLDHIPALIVEISGYVKEPGAEALAANTAMIDKARELGALRHGQRASLHQVLREYQVLGGVLATFVIEETEQLEVAPPAVDNIQVVSRLNHAVNLLSQATVEAFVTLYTQTIAEQHERLEQFTRMAAHEWRQPLGALQFGVSLLRQDGDAERTRRTVDALDRTVKHLVSLTHTLETVARIQAPADTPLIQNVSLDQVAAEAARQMREMADARDVTVRVNAPVMLLVDVGRLELTLVNLLSNAIKYSDPAKRIRTVDVTAAAVDGWCRIEVTDNGIGIPAHALTTIFDRFSRVPRDEDAFAPISGVGLGLAIVDDCVQAMAGRVVVRSTEGQGTTFIVELPLHDDAPA